MADESWSRCLRKRIVEVDETDEVYWDEQKRQQEDDNAHARQCTTNSNRG
jgi:hypothetical protein